MLVNSCLMDLDSIRMGSSRKSCAAGLQEGRGHTVRLVSMKIPIQDRKRCSSILSKRGGTLRVTRKQSMK